MLIFATSQTQYYSVLKYYAKQNLDFGLQLISVLMFLETTFTSTINESVEGLL